MDMFLFLTTKENECDTFDQLRMSKVSYISLSRDKEDKGQVPYPLNGLRDSSPVPLSLAPIPRNNFAGFCLNIFMKSIRIAIKMVI